MVEIKFSHKYEKMPSVVDIYDTFLLQVLVCDYKDLSKEFIEYDTKYFEDENVKFYPLPEGKLLLLFLNTINGGLWTTVRRWTAEKEAYYRGLQGQQVYINVEGE